MTQAITNGTGHSRHSNGHVATSGFLQAQPPVRLPGSPAKPPRDLSLPRFRIVPIRIVDSDDGETIVELEANYYREARTDPAYGDGLGDLPVGTVVVFREAVESRVTGRWLVRRLTEVGWVTEAEATVPDRIIV